MVQPQKQELPHLLTLDNRKKLTISGVTEVESFDDTSVILHTVCGVLMIRGENLQLKTLSIDGGQVVVMGTVISLAYEQPRPTGGFFARLFG